MLSLNSLVTFGSLLVLSSLPSVEPRAVEQRGPGYHLVEEYLPHNFFDKFSFFQYPDPTNGFVQYVSRKEANETGLIKVHKNHTHPHRNHVYVGVDSKNTYSLLDQGRKSVRLQSRKTYTRGLFILNLAHMPFGCGTWPAWWTVGPQWPYNGEIDIIEGVNKNKYNLMSLHTSRGCTIAGARQKGLLVTNDCNSLEENIGCGVLRNHTSSYGKGFNHRGGGVYAMEWTASNIRIWQWPHKDVPESIIKGKPEPSKFGIPSANLAGSCNVAEHFRNHSIVFDMTFCGDFAGYAYGQSNCPLSNLGHFGCNEFVAKNPSAFRNAYWSIKAMHVYQQHGEDVGVYHPPQYSSAIPVYSTAPHSASSLLPPPLGHKTTTTTTAHRTSSRKSHSTTTSSRKSHSTTSSSHRRTSSSSKATSTSTRTRLPTVTSTRTGHPTTRSTITHHTTTHSTARPTATRTSRHTVSRSRKPSHVRSTSKTSSARSSSHRTGLLPSVLPLPTESSTARPH